METNQYGVPMNESRFCIVCLFFAETPKSAEELEMKMYHYNNMLGELNKLDHHSFFHGEGRSQD